MNKWFLQILGATNGQKHITFCYAHIIINLCCGEHFVPKQFNFTTAILISYRWHSAHQLYAEFHKIVFIERLIFVKEAAASFFWP